MRRLRRILIAARHLYEERTGLPAPGLSAPLKAVEDCARKRRETLAQRADIP